MSYLADGSMAATFPRDPRDAAIENYRRAKQWLEPMGWSILGHRLYANEPLSVFHEEYGSGKISILDDGSIDLDRPGGQPGDFLVLQHWMTLYPDGSCDTNADPGFPPIFIFDEAVSWLDHTYPEPNDCSQSARDEHDALIEQAVGGTSDFWGGNLDRVPQNMKFAEEDVAALDRLLQRFQKRPVRAADLRELRREHAATDPPDPSERSNEPAPSALGSELADECPLAVVESFNARFIAYPDEHCRLVHALWITHTHLMDCWESTPRIAFLSPEPGSGKTRALEITELLVPRPVESINATPAYLFRKVSDPAGPPTILYDEIDTLFGPKARDNEEIRGILNAGHRRGAVAGRCVVRGKEIHTEELPAYCAVALAGLGNLPDTLLSRSVVIRMQRRAPTETIEPFRRRLHGPQGHHIRDKLVAWCAEIASQLHGARPEMPLGVEDRAADVWEPLLAIADAAGGDYPRRAREAATALVASAKASTPSLGVRLLGDIRSILSDSEWQSTEELLTALNSMPEAPWGDLRGNPLDSRRLAALLRPYGVHSKSFRRGTAVVRGYSKADFVDPWSRYLPPSSA